jgi:hypothetical protein
VAVWLIAVAVWRITTAVGVRSEITAGCGVPAVSDKLVIDVLGDWVLYLLSIIY